MYKMKNNDSYIIYTDGSCLPGGIGGWAICIISSDKNNYLFSDSEIDTTNNRMELRAIIEAVSCMKENSHCIIYSDSMLCINCATGLWKRKANLDLWKEYDIESKGKNVSFKHVKAHNGDYFNEKVDKLAQSESQRRSLLVLS